MYKIDYETLADNLIENYPPHEHPELYSLYTSMRLHLMKVFNLKETTAVKLLKEIEQYYPFEKYNITRC
mgnify:CR=1 FL=1